jgi:O-acetylhomoserine (thiol)-lyase
VARVHHPGLPEHPEHTRAARLFPDGVGGVFSFDLAVGEEDVTSGVPSADSAALTAETAVEAFVDALDLFALAANIGDARSLVVHPATMTHSRLDAAGRAEAGIDRTTIRLSVGLEDVADLQADLAQALAALPVAAVTSGPARFGVPLAASRP